jgi:hypothetical protein
MIYDKITQGENGMYTVRVFNDEKKRNLIRLDNVKIVDTEDDVVLELSDTSKIDSIHMENIQQAIDNSEAWFGGRKLSEKTLRSAYTNESSISAERIGQTRVYNSKNEPVGIETLTSDTECSVIVEFVGLWFAKKAFGPSWNLVQVKLAPEPEPEEPTFDESYPEDCMFVEA